MCTHFWFRDKHWFYEIHSTTSGVLFFAHRNMAVNMGLSMLASFHLMPIVYYRVKDDT
jgi:hypothetical protein